MNIHINIVHHKIKDFKCDFELCEYISSTKDHLNIHIKMVHNKTKDFKCDYKLCEFKCSTNDNLTRHIKSVHERSQESKKMSIGEYKIYKILENLNIEFKREITFQDLKSEKGRHLRYDFGVQINENKYLLLEFDGRQHFEKVRWSNMDSEKQIIERFAYLQKCDVQKDEYAKNNNHDLLRIKYDDKNVEKRIMDYFNEHYDLNIDE